MHIIERIAEALIAAALVSSPLWAGYAIAAARAIAGAL